MSLLDQLGAAGQLCARAYGAAYCLAADAIQRAGFLGLDAPLIFSESIDIPATDQLGNIAADIPITGEIRGIYWSVKATGETVTVPGAYVSEISIGAVQIYRHQGSQTIFDPWRADSLPFSEHGFLRRIRVIQGQTLNLRVVQQAQTAVTARVVVEMYGANVAPNFGAFVENLWIGK